jgi:hypothetical protein
MALLLFGQMNEIDGLRFRLGTEIFYDLVRDFMTYLRG